MLSGLNAILVRKPIGKSRQNSDYLKQAIRKSIPPQDSNLQPLFSNQLYNSNQDLVLPKTVPHEVKPLFGLLLKKQVVAKNNFEKKQHSNYFPFYCRNISFTYILRPASWSSGNVFVSGA